jgi:hypothetical protein
MILKDGFCRDVARYVSSPGFPAFRRGDPMWLPLVDAFVGATRGRPLLMFEKIIV